MQGQHQYQPELFSQAEVIGVDIADEFVKMASEKYPADNLKFMCGDLRDLSEIKDLTGKRFDIITCFQAISFSSILRGSQACLRRAADWQSLTFHQEGSRSCLDEQIRGFWAE